MTTFLTTPLRAACVLVLALTACDRRDEPAAELPSAPSKPAEVPGGMQVTDLLPREGGDGPLFERVAAEQSGLDFVHRWEPRDDKEREMVARSFAGGCVALGDLDGDGLPEVFLSRPHGGARLYQNLGGFKFRDITAECGIEEALDGPWVAGATFVDIQGDGLLDIYAASYVSPNMLFINTGDGKFVERAAEFGLDYEGASIMMSFADYDRDGDLDAHLLTNRVDFRDRPEKMDFKVLPDGTVITPDPWKDEIGAMIKPDGSLFQYHSAQRDLLYRNDGGKFVEVAEESGMTGYWHGLSATWWDYDSDGWIDLYVANDYFGPDYLYRNNGDGTFTDVMAQTAPYTPWFSMGSDAGDLDGDGRLDYMASDMAATTHYRQKVTMGDMDSEGWFLEYPNPRQYMRNALYINTGTGRFLEVAQMAGMSATDWNWAVKIADFDADGLNDVFFSNGMSRDFFNADLRAEVNATLERTGENRWSDYEQLLEQNLVFRNRGGLDFENVTEAWGLKGDTASFGSGVGDLDGDGDLDLVVNNFMQPVAVFRNRSTSGKLLKVALRGAGANPRAIGAELRLSTAAGEQVRLLNPVRGFVSCDPAEAVFGLGEDSGPVELIIRWPSGKQQVLGSVEAGKRYLVAEAPVAGPIEPDLPPEPMFVERSMTNPPTHVERDYDDFAVQPLLPNRLSLEGPAMAWADIDGNGSPDCFLGGGYGEPAQLWMQSEGKLFRQRMPALVQDGIHEDVDALWFDADGDKDLDLYVVSGGVENDAKTGGYRDRLYLNVGNGLGASPEGALPDMNFSGSCVAAADVDADGDLDLFIGARVHPGAWPTAPASRLLINDGKGSFTDAPEDAAPSLATAGMVTDALWSDADGDGDPDLLLTTEYGPVRYLRNDDGVLVEQTEAAGLAKRLGWWNTIAAGDFDGDGDPDFAIGNFGLNTKYHPSPDKPQLVFYGDFEGNGEAHCVEAHLEGDQLVPNRGRSCSSGAMPFIREKFTTFHSFAVAELADIYSPPKLSSSLKLEANELASGVLLNDGAGKFTFRPLPTLAQVAPCFGIIALHANDDDNLDLYISQNFHGPQRETGHMSGGLGALLLGDGSGDFRAVAPRESGIVVPEDARDAAAIDFDGDGRADLAIAVNNGPLRLLLRAGNR